MGKNMVYSCKDAYLDFIECCLTFLIGHLFNGNLFDNDQAVVSFSAHELHNPVRDVCPCEGHIGPCGVGRASGLCELLLHSHSQESSH